MLRLYVTETVLEYRRSLLRPRYSLKPKAPVCLKKIHVQTTTSMKDVKGVGHSDSLKDLITEVAVCWSEESK